MNTPVIEAQGVCVELGGSLILRDINISIEPGETIVLIGPSGAGKTVLLKTLMGIYEPSQGQVRCYGHRWRELSSVGRHDLASHVGMQFQKAALFDDLSTIENAAYPLREHTQLKKQEIEARALECLRMVGLAEAKDRMPYELSGGMRLRLGVARSIALKPELLIMDDPTAGLDPVSSDDMANLILNLKKEIGATLVVVTCDIQRAFQFAGRIFLLADKTLIECGTAEQTRRHPDPRVHQFINGLQEGPLTELESM